MIEPVSVLPAGVKDALDRDQLVYPDFVVKTTKGDVLLVETKGREDIDVPRKDARAAKWCEDATELAGTTWRYLKASEQVFRTTTATTLEELYR